MKYLENVKINLNNRRAIASLIVLVLFVGTFVMAKAASIEDALGGGSSGTDQIDALVKSILESVESGQDGAGITGLTTSGEPAAEEAEKKVPKRSVIMDEEEILDAVEIVGDVSEGATIQAITFNKEMTIADALRFLALKYHRNIIPSVNVDGMITVTNLYNVTFEQALEAIIGPNKYEIDDDGLIRIYTPEEYSEDENRMVNDIISLNYITAAEAAVLIDPVLSDAGEIAVTTPAKTDTEAGEGGDSLAAQDRVVIHDFPDVIEEAKRILADVDVPPLQILIEVTILEATLNETTKFGIDWNILGLSEKGTLGEESFNQTGFANSVGNNGLSVGVMNASIEVLIQAIETITDTTVLANPKILALNKQAGKLLIGDEKGYKTTSTTTSGITSEDVKFLESGTLLEFRPYVCGNGMIRMEIHPEQSESTFNDDTKAPDKSTTTVQTNVLVRDGKTIVLGGLFKEKTDLTRSQVPILGDIPVAGTLFEGTSDESERVELIVLITPHIISEPEQTRGEDKMNDVHRINDKARSNLVWMSRARIAEDRYRKAVEYYLDGNKGEALSILNGISDMDRNYVEAEKLRERIISETQPGNIDRMKRIMLDNIQEDDSDKWMKR